MHFYLRSQIQALNSGMVSLVPTRCWTSILGTVGERRWARPGLPPGTWAVGEDGHHNTWEEYSEVITRALELGCSIPQLGSTYDWPGGSCRHQLHFFRKQSSLFGFGAAVFFLSSFHLKDIGDFYLFVLAVPHSLQGLSSLKRDWALSWQWILTPRPPGNPWCCRFVLSRMRWQQCLPRGCSKDGIR